MPLPTGPAALIGYALLIASLFLPELPEAMASAVFGSVLLYIYIEIEVLRDARDATGSSANISLSINIV